MSTESSTRIIDAEATVAVRYCPKCDAANPLSELVKNDYRCGACGFEVAYLDVTTSGVVRGILGWIHRDGEVIEKRYRVTSVLGRGGFGATYLVEDLQLNGRRRALKEIPREMFNEAEASLLARLDHPAIPDIIDRFSSEHAAYLVLKFGGTRTLGSERKRLGGRIPLATLAPWIHELCGVLAYLHSQIPPIIHRDLKPDNILLNEQDRVMLIDFGIAKLADPIEATRTLGRAVSFGFSSPEQIMGTGTDQRSDIYSLGATVYFLLTGSHPPPLNAQLGGKKLESLAKVVPGIPPRLDQALLKALELNPERRQQSIDELLGVFEELLRKPPGSKSRDDHQRKNLMILTVLLAGLLAVAGIGFLMWHVLRERASSPPVSVPPEKSVEPTLPGPTVTPSDEATKSPESIRPAPPTESLPLAPTPATPQPSSRETLQPSDAAPPGHDQAAPRGAEAEPKRAPEPLPSSPETPARKATARPTETPSPRGIAPAESTGGRAVKVPPKKTTAPARVVPKAKPAPKPKPPTQPRTVEAPTAPAPTPRAPSKSIDWSGTMTRGATRKTTP